MNAGWNGPKRRKRYHMRMTINAPAHEVQAFISQWFQDRGFPTRLSIGPDGITKLEIPDTPEVRALLAREYPTPPADG